MQSLEERMAEALRGKFYWESTTKINESENLMTSAIRQAQREIRQADGRYKECKGIKPVSEISREQAARKLAHLFDVVSGALFDIYGVERAEVLEDNRQKRICFVRSMLAWLLKRYHLGASYTRLGVLLKRDHSTVINMIQQFELVKDNHLEQIQKIDEIVGHKEI